jgi:hypothetical protein
MEIFTQKEIVKMSRQTSLTLIGIFDSYIREDGYYNETNRYKIKTKKKVLMEDGTVIEIEKKKNSRVGILLYMGFLFYPISKEGFIKNVNTRKMAKMLDVTHNTIINNMERLTENELISVSKVAPYTYNIYLIDYEKLFLTKKEGGSGYVVITREMYEKMLKIDDINSLRLELRRILEYSKHYNLNLEKYFYEKANKPNNNEESKLYPYNPNINYSKNIFAEFELKYLQYSVPKYLRYPKKIKELLFDSKLFENTIKGNSLFFRLKEKNTDEILMTKSFKYYSKFEKMLKKLYPYIEDKDIINNSYDLSILSIHEYGFKAVKQAVEDIAYNYEYTVKNIVGFVRTYLDKPLRFKYLSKEKIEELEKEAV